MLPSLFISHGTPALCIMQCDSRSFLEELPSFFKKPKYVIVISAHWITRDLRILSKDNPSIIYDFYGFPQELYDKKYPIKNNLTKVDAIINAFNESEIEISKDDKLEGYDHGVWAPLSLMYPNADIPVIQISLPYYASEKELINIGEVLQKFRDEALIIGSGTLTHNLRDSVRDINAPIKSYAKEFRDWIVDKVEKADIDALSKVLIDAPNLKNNHPTLDHFLPFLIALGASKDKKGKALNNVVMFGNQAMDTILFES